MCADRHTQELVKSVRFPELRLQVVVSHPMWVLGAKLGSSARAVCTRTPRYLPSPE